MELLQISVTAVLLLCAAAMDAASGKIKNKLLLSGLLVGILLWIPGIRENGCKDFLMGLLLPVCICWIPFRMHGLGAGDVKLFCVVGCLNGGRVAIYCICISFLLAAGFSFGRLLNQRQFYVSMRNCIQYFQMIARNREIMPYPERNCPGHRFHFSMAILLGYIVILGVKVCRIIPF